MNVKEQVIKSMKADAISKSPDRASYLSTEYIHALVTNVCPCKCWWRLETGSENIWLIALTQVIKISLNNHWTKRRFYFFFFFWISVYYQSTGALRGDFISNRKTNPRAGDKTWNKPCLHFFLVFGMGPWHTQMAVLKDSDLLGRSYLNLAFLYYIKWFNFSCTSLMIICYPIK